MANEPVVVTPTAAVKSRARSDNNARLSAILLSTLSILVSFILVEGAFRTAIFLNIDYFLDPSIYSYPFHDNYWKLSYRWHQQVSESTSNNLNPDPLLGWSPPISPDNPLGLIGMESYQPDSREPVILFYGDSFVAGKTERPEDNIPNQLSAQLPETEVYNYGVSNYGVDQIYLRLRQTHESFGQPTLLVGIFTLDMDRSMISLRSGAPKPYFTLGENDSLVLHNIDGVPVNTTPADWIAHWHENNPPRLPSYAWSFLIKRLDGFRTNGDWLNTTQKRTEIEALNGQIISEMVMLAQKRDIPIHFVIFYTRQELDVTYWRETFLRQHLESLGVPILDSKPLLIEAAQQAGEPLDSYYFADGGHTNEIGNLVIAKALAAQLSGK